MHTDEYDISTRREITLCRKVIDRLKSALLSREKLYGMTTEAFLIATDRDLPADRSNDLRNWREDHEELEAWQRRLRDYEQTLKLIEQI